jgi:hypothetical protein
MLVEAPINCFPRLDRSDLPAGATKVTRNLVSQTANLTNFEGIGRSKEAQEQLFTRNEKDFPR